MTPASGSGTRTGPDMSRDHITVCICTYRRQHLLGRLLREFQKQDTAGLFTYSIVVVDNDHTRSAKTVVDAFSAQSPLEVRYYCEPEQNIALARNRAIGASSGTFVALIDDDEWPDAGWLVTLHRAIHQYVADGVLGPVKPSFEEEPPQWVIDGKFYEKPQRIQHRTGEVLRWTDTRTSNVLLRREIFDDANNIFEPSLGRGGEDKEFFSRMIEKGYVFVWCHEAPVFEAIPLCRTKRSFMLRRALLRGKMSLLYPSTGLHDTLKSVVAISLYTLALPFLLFGPHHIFMRFLISYCDHIGRILAICGLDVIKQKYVME